jgi:hypothetical protein
VSAVIVVSAAIAGNAVSARLRLVVLNSRLHLIVKLREATSGQPGTSEKALR